MSTTREDRLRAFANQAATRLVRAGEVLASRQAMGGPNEGNVPPWPGATELDFHGTLAAAWVWTRAQKVAGDDHFALNLAAAWGFVERVWDKFIPHALGPSASDEAAYDCAMVLRAVGAEVAGTGAVLDRPRAEGAARLLGAYLSDLDDFGGREFKDPGFLAWSLAEYARDTRERGLLATVRRFTDRAFGMKMPSPFAAEPAARDGLFDFSSTTATRILAVIAAEGATPFVGAWLRERVGSNAPKGFVARPIEENTWNASMATALGRAYVVATDETFFGAYQAVLGELDRRSEGGGLGRAPGFAAETSATFYYALSVDSLVKA
jgi:hypothetical protein